MSTLPQLVMIRDNMDNLPSLIIPDGLKLCTHRGGDEADWCRIIKEAFGWELDFDEYMKNMKGYTPEGLFYIEKDGRKIATTAAIENENHPGKGWFHMVASLPEARGLGAGKAVATAALLNLAERGFKSAGLSTDDERIPAIKLYLSLGFKPYYNHESHEGRWKNVMDIINKKM